MAKRVTNDANLQDFLEIVIAFYGLLGLIVYVADSYGYFNYAFYPIASLLLALLVFMHSKRKGKSGFGMRHTGEEVTEGYDLSGKVAIVTGPTSGIGMETARVLALRGAHVILASRNFQKMEQTKRKLESSLARQCGMRGKFTCIRLELSSLKSVKRFISEFRKLDLPLNILVNNAGLMALPARMSTEEGVEMQMGVNHVAHHYLSTELLPDLKRGAPSRVVTVSSMAYQFCDISFLESDKLETNGYSRWLAYTNSKLANILFSKEFNKRYEKEGVKSYSLNPGAIRTSLQGHMTYYGMFKLFLVFPFILKSVGQGAATSIYCAVHRNAEKDAGKYFDDCNVAAIEPIYKKHVTDANAKLLWEKTENIIKSSKL